MGGSMPWPQVPVGNKDHTEAAVLIIGSGISGMCTAIDLLTKNKCRNFIIVEKSGGLGGTWRDNKFPGCCCDVWSHLYSYSFEQSPDWTREYPGQEEILQYLLGVAHKYELYRYIRFNTEVESAKWNEQDSRWHTKVKVPGGKDAEFGNEYTIKSDFLVSAVGQLNQPQMPDIEGIDQFNGKIMHSARWDWSYDLQGKRIAIIGNGATAAQIIPELVPVAKHLTVHQRSPCWVIPRFDQPIPEWKRAMYRYVPYTRQRKRADMMDVREKIYKSVSGNSAEASEWLTKISKNHLRSQLPGREDLWKKLEPTYAIGCKRTVTSDDYFPSFACDNVHLETGRINKITTRGITTDGKETEYDLIVLATGFKALEFMYPIQITGIGGRDLSTIWKNGGEALYGVTVPFLPNFSMLYGPNTNLGHSSIVLMIEAQSRYINTLIKEVLQAKVAGNRLVIEPSGHKVAEYNRQLQAELNKSSFADTSCQSWFKRKDTGKITNNWSQNVVSYQKLLSTVTWADFDLTGPGSDRLQIPGAVTKLGRVVEETIVSYQTMALAALGLAALGTTIAIRSASSRRAR